MNVLIDVFAVFTGKKLLENTLRYMFLGSKCRSQTSNAIASYRYVHCFCKYSRGSMSNRLCSKADHHSHTTNDESQLEKSKLPSVAISDSFEISENTTEQKKNGSKLLNWEKEI